MNTSLEINGKTFELDKDFSVNVAQTNTSTYRFSEIVFAGYGVSDSYKG